MRSASPTRARRASRTRASPGRADHVSAGPSRTADEPGGLTAAFRAVRARVGSVLVLLVVARVCWWWAAEQMAGMDTGPWSSLGSPGWFLGAWTVMMAAMMF